MWNKKRPYQYSSKESLKTTFMLHKWTLRYEPETLSVTKIFQNDDNLLERWDDDDDGLRWCLSLYSLKTHEAETK